MRAAGQVAKAGMTYVSEVFAVTRGVEYATGPWGNCSAKCGYGIRRREVRVWQDGGKMIEGQLRG